jgi:hypothetical protein
MPFNYIYHIAPTIDQRTLMIQSQSCFSQLLLYLIPRYSLAPKYQYLLVKSCFLNRYDQYYHFHRDLRALLISLLLQLSKLWKSWMKYCARMIIYSKFLRLSLLSFLFDLYTSFLSWSLKSNQLQGLLKFIWA